MGSCCSSPSPRSSSQRYDRSFGVVNRSGTRGSTDQQRKRKPVAAPARRPVSTQPERDGRTDASKGKHASSSSHVSSSSRKKHSVSIEVDAALIRLIQRNGGATQQQIERETGVVIKFSSSKNDNQIVVEGISSESVTEASKRIGGVLEEIVKSPSLDYSHFISLPLAIHPELVEKLENFQNSILGCSTSNHDELGIDRSIFIKPRTFHLTVLMLKLWNKDRVAAASEVLRKVSSKVIAALDNRPVFISLKGLDCMRGSAAKAQVVYAPIEEIGGEGRLLRACQVIIQSYVEAGLVLEKDAQQALKVAELLLTEESFEPNIRDFSKLIDAYSKADKIQDAERILNKMTKNGIKPDILTYIILLHMYSKVGDLDRAKDAFESLKTQGFQPDLKAYTSMITAYVKAGDPKQGENLTREMEARDIRPTKEIYMELLRSFAEQGQVDGAQRIMNTMQFSGIQPSLESSTLLVEAYGQSGDPDQARGQFDQMRKAGHKPDDQCTASMMAAYAKKNLLDKALDLLLTLEQDGFKPGIATKSVLVDWLGRLQLVEEAERVLEEIAVMGEAPFQIHVSLCDMYSRAGNEEKAKKSLKVLEGKKKLLRADQFERIVSGLLAGGMVEDAKRIYQSMQGLGHTPSEPLKVTFMAAQSIPRQQPGKRRW